MPDTVEDALDIAQMHDTLFVHAQDAIAVADTDFGHAQGPRFISVNPAFERVFGFRAAETPGKRLNLIFPAEALAVLLRRLKTGDLTDDAVESEFAATSKEGKRLHVAVRLLRIFSVGGKLVQIALTLRDLTASRRKEHERQTTERLFATIFTLVAEGIAVADDSGRFAMANPAFTRQLGISAADILGRPLGAFVQDADKQIQIALQARDSGRGAAAAKTKRDPVQVSTAAGKTRSADLIPITVDRADGYPYWLVRLAGEPIAAASAPAPAPVLAPARPNEAPPVGFDPAIRRALERSDKTPRTIVAGKLQLIGLDEVRDALGDKWPAFAKRTLDAAESIIKRMLSAHDAVSRTEDGGFLVCFADLDEQAASFKANALRREIRDRLVGESPELVEANVASFVAEIPLPDNIDDPDFDFAAAVENRLKLDRGQREKALRQSLWTEITPGTVRFEPVQTHTGQSAPLLLARLPEKLEMALDALAPTAENPVHHEARMLLLSAVAEHAISARKAASELILVPIHIDILLDRRSRESFLKIAHNIEDIGKRRLVVEIYGQAKDVGPTRLTDIATRCAPYFRAVAIELADCNDQTLAADLPQSVRILTLPARRAIVGQAITPSFARVVKGSALRMRQLLVKEVGSPAQAKILTAAGVRLLAGVDPGAV